MDKTKRMFQLCSRWTKVKLELIELSRDIDELEGSMTEDELFPVLAVLKSLESLEDGKERL
jgi:hypothetical protein